MKHIYIVAVLFSIFMVIPRVAVTMEISGHPKCFEKGYVYKAQTIDNGGPPGSGGMDSDAIPCCAGLVERNTKDYCRFMPDGGKADMVCIACGDSRCESAYEDKCNCPEDCKR